MSSNNNEVECLVEPTSKISITEENKQENKETTTTTTTNTDNKEEQPQEEQPKEEQEQEEQQEEEQEQQTENPENLIKHPLQNRWSLWYDYQSGKINPEHWVDSLKKVISFDSVEDFWCVFNNLPNVSNLKQGSSYHLFKDDIEPKWEHESNKRGGKWFVMVKDKSRCDNQWLQSVMACVGETFDSSDEICGIVYNSRKNGDKISVWTKNAHDEKATKDIGYCLKKILEVDNTISYTPHEDVMRTSKGAKNLYEC
ncbi:hypothetical protein DICPUDRAFT_41544 [Dictyostelium purpureum]|uniref:Eukaryotic translation initiation factor 4E n=1 Tax=Dictyostelium purpureum TaxID=5786 RepID=F1A0A9_DICPU|nr:uncharacterized protein DICPUDRAFT_41544 [Dictyostelium purpureum]EGC30364.1 hypothetical protein DICPUDRAFT_41544 [Dictyostelium purpureum]|eukprot:XP_003293106.1 hypothetical protein DICPUDRAFT_41544 [Dictyostelium purpureum]